MSENAGNIEESSLALANWWADRVFGGTVASNGDGVNTALSVLAGVQGSTQSGDKRELFVKALSSKISGALERMSKHSDDPRVTLGVDYGPDMILSEAAEAAGLFRPNFPWKTMTWAYSTHVVVSLGYGGRNVLLWQSSDWVRPNCNAGKYDDNWDRLPWKCSSLAYHDGEHDFSTPDKLCIAKVRDGVCHRSEEDFLHRIEEDGYRSSRYHEFVS